MWQKNWKHLRSPLFRRWCKSTALAVPSDQGILDAMRVLGLFFFLNDDSFSIAESGSPLLFLLSSWYTYSDSSPGIPDDSRMCCCLGVRNVAPDFGSFLSECSRGLLWAVLQLWVYQPEIPLLLGL